jgi:hypothetical protein
MKMTLIEATRVIQPNLEKLDAAAAKLPLAGLLGRADQGENVNLDIQLLFKDYPRAWQAIQESLGMEMRGATKKEFAQIPAGGHDLVGSDRYLCSNPACDYRWYRQKNANVPLCEKCGQPLKQSGE